jgi:hypothetical protein
VKKTTLKIGHLRTKKFLSVVEKIQKDFPKYHLIVELDSSGLFSTTYFLWVRELDYIDEVLKIFDDELHL